MPRYGIKVWSKDVLKNPDFFNEAAEAVKNGTFGYIELFAIPDSFNETQSLIAPAIKGLPVVIHAPHSCFGLDTGNPELETSNQKKFEDSLPISRLVKCGNHNPSRRCRSKRSLPERNNPPVPQYRRQPDCRRKPSVNMLVNTCAPPWQHTG